MLYLENDFYTPKQVDQLKKAFQIQRAFPIQTISYRPLRRKEDAFLKAPTGSGKTLAYLLPLLANSLEAEKNLLVVAPTQELAIQIVDVARLLETVLDRSFGALGLVGGANIQHQIDGLKKKPTVIAGTPGRILELFERRKLKAQDFTAVVFDEADALAVDDKGQAQCELIKKRLLRDVQTIVVSATLNWENDFFLKSLLTDPLFLSTQNTLPDQISHYYMRVPARAKNDHLRSVLAATKAKHVMVFLNKPDQIERTAQKLQHHQIKAAALYADMPTHERKNTLQAFRDGKIQALITSDLASRGLDIQDVDLIIQLDAPINPETYLHRAGRTGRRGTAGENIVFIDGKEEAVLRIYERDLGIRLKETFVKNGELVEGKAPTPTPQQKRRPNPTTNKPKRKKNRLRDRKNKGRPKKRGKDTK